MPADDGQRQGLDGGIKGGYSDGMERGGVTLRRDVAIAMMEEVQEGGREEGGVKTTMMQRLAQGRVSQH